MLRTALGVPVDRASISVDHPRPFPPMNSPNPLAASSRRHFLKHFTLSTAVSMAGGKLWTARLLAEVTYGDPNNGIAIKISDYPALRDQFGSVRFAFADPSNRATYPFVLTRAEAALFYAVDTKCTHAGCVVEAYANAPYSSMTCYCHGSEYAIDGRVINGPATNDLLTYPVKFDGLDTVTVKIPGLDLAIRNVSVQQQNGATVRVRLDFPTVQDGHYRVHFRQSLSDPELPILLSTAPTIAPSLTQITANGQPATVYVDAPFPQGFFSVALIVEQY